MKVAGVKMVNFTQYPQKKSIEKFGNFSTTDNPLIVVSCRMNTMSFLNKVRVLKIKLL